MSKIDELMNKMTLEEKISQLMCMFMGKDIPDAVFQYFPNGFGAVAAIISTDDKNENLKEAEREQKLIMDRNGGIPALRHAEALTGLLSADATVFPSAIGLAATWNPNLVYEMADTIRKQMVSIGVRHALSPVMDVARDPRWGRVGETYGEDPTLCSAMSVAFTKGIQGKDLSKGVVATGKHFLGYGMSQGGLNMSANAIPQRELREVYAKPFQAAITEGKLWGIMNSYGTIDNELVIDSKEILSDLLRDEMGFEGIVVSDYMSINRMLDLKVTDNAADGGGRALEAGLDIELPSPFGFTPALIELIEEGKISEERVDEAVRRVLTTKEKLGLFEHPAGDAELLEDAYNTDKNRELSLLAAKQAIVLLKNDGILPITQVPNKVAVIGPHGDSIRNLFGCYTFAAQLDRDMSGSMADMPGMQGLADETEEATKQMDYFEGSTVRKTSNDVEEALRKIYAGRTDTILESIRQKWNHSVVEFEQGCDIAGTRDDGFSKAIELAKNSDIVILTLGGKYGWGTNCTTGEGIDCDKVGLLGVQEKLLKAVCETGTPVILVHMDAKPLMSEYAEEHCSAIIENWFPGETGGRALAEVLAGDYNPSGKLPMTAIRNEGQIPIYHSAQNGSSYYDEKGMIISKYVDGSKQPLHYFGEGLSYTSFTYSNLAVDAAVDPQEILHLSFDVTNTGDRQGDEIVQLYISDDVASMVRPGQELAGFQRISLEVGETKTVHFDLKVSQLAFLNRKMEWIVEAGDMTVKVGASSRDIRLEDHFHIKNTAIVDGKTRGFYAESYTE